MIEVEFAEPGPEERRESPSLLSNPTSLAVFFFSISLVFRLIDIFILNMGDTDFGILPSKVIPLILILAFLHHTKQGISAVGLHAHLVRAGVFLGLVASLVYLGISVGGVFVSLGLIGANPIISLYKFDYLGQDLIYQTANAIMEEVLFRGLMLRCFMTRFSLHKANFLQAFCFGLWHVVWPINTLLAGYISLEGAMLWSIEYTLSGTIMGFAWGYMFLRSGTLVAPILNHFVINFSSAYVIVEGLESASSMIEMVCPMAAVLGVFLIVILLTRSDKVSRVTPWSSPQIRES
ncbi:MAG: CPBP family intramembrane metalloprotease [Candidatus Thorarchaeota archaeon]|nr:CPBP family intramembrane metalloprotease [Candidatus Thorarchaeota archaeon]